MKKLYTLVLVLLFIFEIIIPTNIYAQQAVEIDPQFVKLSRYANTVAITAAITTSTQGMMVYNNFQTQTPWTYNGTSWVNSASNGSVEIKDTNTDTRITTEKTLFAFIRQGKNELL